MKKTIMIAAVAMIVILAAVLIIVSTAALKGGLVVFDTVAEDDQLFYLTVSLEKPVMGTSMAVSYEFDHEVLEMVPESSEWIPEGVIRDFYPLMPQGVWASKDMTELSGDLCRLAFRVRPDAAYSKTKVSCTIMIRNDSGEEFKYTATGVIKPSCQHKYSPWETKGAEGHARTCSSCGKVQLQDHVWDEGKWIGEQTDDGKAKKLYTCLECGAEKTALVTEQTGDNQTGSGGYAWGDYFGNHASEPTESAATSPTESGWWYPYLNSGDGNWVSREEEQEETKETTGGQGTGWGNWASPGSQNNGAANSTEATTDPHEGHDHP